MRNLFLNTEEKRLKAGWRILLFIIIFYCFSALIFVVRPLIGDISKSDYLRNYSLVIVSILALAGTITVFIARKYWDKKNVSSLGLKWNKGAVKDLVFGFVLSGAMAALFFITLVSTGLLGFNGFQFQLTPDTQSFDYVQFMSILTLGSLGLMLLETILVGYWEELVFRGYLFQNLIEGLGLISAIIFSCILYGIIHCMNPSASLLSSTIIVAFGFLRIYGYLGTKLLWLSMGMHIGWNFFQGPIFGFAASGHKSATLIQHEFLSDKQFLTGGEFGPEGSILIIPILLLALWVMRWYSHSYYPRAH